MKWTSLLLIISLLFSFNTVQAEGDGEFDAAATAFHHIDDANVFSIGPWSIPLPCILKSDDGWNVFSSGKFHIHGHGNGTMAIDGYVLNGGQVMKIKDSSFPKGEVQLLAETASHDDVHHFYHHKKVDGKTKYSIDFQGKHYDLDVKSTLDGGFLGGGITSFHDFSITKNVISMILMSLLLFFLFRSIAKSYARREGQAPSGIQSLIEPIFLFIQEDVSKPFLGHKWQKFQPFLMCLFFFILALNLFGQIPFFGGANVTGSLSVTMVLALFAFFVTNLNGNGHYWEHVFWMPGIPAWVKLILTPVEIMGVLMKPLILMLRLFANITAGHIVITIFVSLIFIFGKSGDLPGAAYGASIGSIILGLFMMAIELLVAFIQAFVFTILTASYIGAATEESHH